MAGLADIDGFKNCIRLCMCSGSRPLVCTNRDNISFVFYCVDLKCVIVLLLFGK